VKQLGITISTFLILFCSLFSQAQQTVTTNTSVTVPPLVNFSGALTDVNGKPLSGTVGVTFLLYKEAQGGSPLWLETQNVQPDKAGHYTVMLGSTSSTGLPSDIFVAGEAHWLGVQVQGQQQEEQPRVLLVSAPYALKAGDAETIGGLPPSAFVLALRRLRREHPARGSLRLQLMLTSRAQVRSVSSPSGTPPATSSIPRSSRRVRISASAP
jgi:hypothetical protein